MPAGRFLSRRPFECAAEIACFRRPRGLETAREAFQTLSICRNA
jgi:hypothetical protein